MPVTKFAIPDKYNYLEGFGSYHQSEALPGANPIAANSPQVPPYRLYTERISGTSFTAPRAENLQTFMYRTSPTFEHGPFKPYEDDRLCSKPEGGQKLTVTPNPIKWDAFPVGSKGDWVTSQRMIAQAGDPTAKTGLAYHIYAAVEDMAPNSVFFSADGDYLIIPQAGTLDIKTELGSLLIRQNEIAVIPRGIRYRVTLPHGPARGYICELFQSHFTLPELGPIGSCSLANARDFQVPVACFDGRIDDKSGHAEADDSGEWLVIAKMNSRLFVCAQDATPFNVAAWHGTYYPFKYDLGRFSVIGSTLFDHPDPSIFTVLTAPSHRQPGHAVVDFVIFPPRYNVMENTFWPPYYHRNTMAEFVGWIINDQSPSVDTTTFLKPFGAKLNNPMVPHGMDKAAVEAAREKELKPTKVDNGGVLTFVLESEMMMGVSEYALEDA